jgi:hypothetical protein
VAGLISEQMQGAGGMPAGQMPPDPMAGQMSPDMMGEEQEANPDDPNFDDAVEYLNEVLYGQAAAKDISSQLKSAPDLAAGLSDVAYNITSILDEKTDGNVPDEMLVPLAMKVLEEVVEIAEATGLDPQPEDIATAFKQMILRYLQEQGLDTTQLDEAMNQVDPSVFRKVAEENTEEV